MIPFFHAKLQKSLKFSIYLVLKHLEDHALVLAEKFSYIILAFTEMQVLYEYAGQEIWSTGRESYKKYF